MPLKRQKTIEEQYQKLSQLEHILLRPDSYIGSIEVQHDKLWVYDAKSEEMAWRDLRYVPGLYKTFDEILVNAVDNFSRDPENMTQIKVEIDEKEGRISVENNGRGLPVEMHSEHKMYVPEMVFGHLLTSDNYDDDEKKVTGGRNGYGAKLANIFSSKFQIECADSERHKRYLQTWENNMKTKHAPKIVSHKGGSFTKVTFWPDLTRFGMKKLEKDIVALMSRRVLDAAGTTPKRCKVTLNGERFGINDFKDYVELYLGSEGPAVVHEQCNERWEIAAAASDGQFQQVSFVNGIATLKGGTHVAHVADQLVEAILKRVVSKNKGGMEIKSHHVRNYLWLFVNCKIENPTFDSQTKETLTLKQTKFGSRCEVSDGLIGRLLKVSGIVDMILQWAKAKEAIDLGKSLKAPSAVASGRSRRLLIPKLEDANLAGGRESSSCTLILTEGDSAKSLAVAGLSVVGRDRFGVFPLRGKLLNVRDASFAQTMANAEIANITKILGLEPKKTYSSVRELRYGHVMVMADQDFDGSHIKGLILNFVQHWWPSLFRQRGFLQEFVTPIVKVSRGKQVQQFFTLGDYEAWREATPGKWQTKYYKGLGTSTTHEAKEYFRRIAEHRLDFEYTGTRDDAAIDLAFNKKRADDRKEWINGATDAQVDHSSESLTYFDFVQKELVQFAKYDVMRSIPCVIDGFKPVQRKIMWACFKRNLRSDVKVVQLAGYVSEHAAYHHGESSLQGAIVCLAQNFVGSNNVNLLTPSGQFGTRLQGGKDVASARYIFTRLEAVARLIFHPDDDAVLDYLSEEGQSVEPQFYVPVLPLILLNGAEGIGTGWSTTIPSFDPRDVVENLLRYIRSEPLRRMCPWYRGFTGSILPSAEKESYDFLGVVHKTSPTQLVVTELPVKRWTQDYKEFLQSLLEGAGGSGGAGAAIEDFREYHTEQTVHFVITVTDAQMARLQEQGLERSLRLRSSVPVSNMYCFDEHGRIKKYADEREILAEFAAVRLRFYRRRKAHLLLARQEEFELLAERARFIHDVVEERLQVRNRKRDQVVLDLRGRGFRPAPEISRSVRAPWDYLLGMPLWSLSLERAQELERLVEEKKRELRELQGTAPEELWVRDLHAISDELDRIDARTARVRSEEALLRTSALKRGGGSGGSGGEKRRRVEVPREASECLSELQERHLGRTLAEFPGVFDLGSRDFRPGRAVVLHGLQSAPEMNGRRGVLRCYDAASDRWEVDVEGGVKRLRTANLQAG